MGIGLGAIYPNFQSENPGQSVTSLGGLIYMTLSMGFIGAVIVLEAGPVYRIFLKGIHGFHLTAFQWLWIGGSFSFVLFLCMIALVIPMRLGEQKLSKEELGRYDSGSMSRPVS